MEKQPRVKATKEAAALIAELKKENGPLMFHQSGGCCDGSQPMCFELGEFKVGSSDVCLGELEDCPFWMAEFQFEYWQHSELTIDVTDGRGAGFSLEVGKGKRFIVRSRLFKEEEVEHLVPITRDDKA